MRDTSYDLLFCSATDDSDRRGAVGTRSSEEVSVRGKQGSATEEQLLNDPTVAFHSSLKEEVRGCAPDCQRLKRLEFRVYEDIRACVCASYIGGFSRFSRCFGLEDASELGFRRRWWWQRLKHFSRWGFS